MSVDTLLKSKIDPASFAAMIGITEPLQAIEPKLGLTPVAPDQGGIPKDIMSKLEDFEAQLREIQNSLESVTQCGKDVIDKLEMAMTKLYKLAVFIRGDYDSREPDRSQQDELLNQAVQAFNEVEGCARAGLEKVSRLHAQAMEIEATANNAVERNVPALFENSHLEIAALKEQIYNTEEYLRDLQMTIDKESQGIKTINDDVFNDRLLDKCVEITAKIQFAVHTALTLGQEELDWSKTKHTTIETREADRIIKERQGRASDAATKLVHMLLKRLILESRLNAAFQNVEEITVMWTRARNTTDNCKKLLGQFGPMKERSARLLLSAGKIHSDATAVQALAYTKKEFAGGLLKICRDSLIDQALIDEASKVKDEVINEYGGAVPEEFQTLASEVSERMSRIKTVPSIRT
ncbi:hypothetical protein B0T20DRAFT_348448 [Sordaria brevicollis]|uniref:Uncharacterized protein n=1 Tax=Sordaria brevicollis TaxID=83679 RepID=A0AAE0UEE0_SORBR|nr:hypothetical protein B0T20DRAFT_348448 [Sordaria brevicollis]